jgi:hypothetical protein
VEGSLRLDDPWVGPVPPIGGFGQQIRPVHRVDDPNEESTNASPQVDAGAVAEFLRREAPLEYERLRSVGRLPATG